MLVTSRRVRWLELISLGSSPHTYQLNSETIMRRMVNTKITDQDNFLDMPPTSRLLYYDLLVRADDDGFITPNHVIRMTGAALDDLKILLAKQFVHQWNDGVVVLLHWREHNHVKNDRYTPSDYSPRLRALSKLYVMGARQVGSKTDPKRIRSGSKTDPQDRLGEDRVGVKKTSKKSARDLSPEEVREIAAKYSVREGEVEGIREELSLYCESTGKAYKDCYAALQAWVRRRVSEGVLKKRPDAGPASSYVEPEGPRMDPATREKRAREIRERLTSA